MKYLNLGCGSRYHPDWINIDIEAHGPGVQAHDLRRGVPLPDSSCDVVYHSAVLEHLRPPEAIKFLCECRRVLKAGGILRVAVPDLERICRLYLQKLEAASSGDDTAARDYDWIMLELFDQTVREQSGGAMLNYLKQNPLPNEAFINERIGEEGRQLIRLLRDSQGQFSSPAEKTRFNWKRKAARASHLLRDALAKSLLGEDGAQALEIGRFRLAGEVHQWMYDRYSLAQLLRYAGFENVEQQQGTTSRIPNWTDFHLDSLPDGTIIKPDSLFMEAIKPTS